MPNKCNGSTYTLSVLPMPGFSPSRAPAVRNSKHHCRTLINTTTSAPCKLGGCDFEVASELLSVKSANEQISDPLSKPIYDVFLGGSCGNTVWRRDLVIPYLEKHAISYYDPQRSVWNEHMINEESVAKENSSLFLFVLDPATVNATSFLEIAHFAARKAPKLVVVFLGQSEWKKQAHPEDLADRKRTCDLLDDILTIHEVPVLHSIQDALYYIDEIIIGEKSWSEALSNPLQRLPYILLRGKRVCRHSVNHVRDALRSVKSGVTKWRGTKFLLLGLFEILLLLPMYFFLRTLPLFLLLIPFLAFDVFVALFSAIYYCYKLNAAARRRAKLVHHSGATTFPLPIPGRAFVPCSIVAQQVPLNYCYQSVGRNVRSIGNSLSSDLLNKRCYNSSSTVTNPLRWMNTYGYDIFLGCSSRNRVDLIWINHRAAPQLQLVLSCDYLAIELNNFYSRKGLSFCSELMVGKQKRLHTLRMTKHILYHIPSCETMLSGMVEVAYFLGHATMELTICVPKRAEMFTYTSDDDEELRKYIERRNESYRMAFCYLRDMAKRKHCEVFSDLDDALQYVISCSKK
ncbi:unnamed protein product [Thelazia callipaeda]|uniref:Raw n=1 Tax=Thelazia callipaeda TaxID=103827 RepID=A0A0N5CX17_THECL|nr:unnamed protein product [Thelazia callipaeda]